MKVTRWYGSFDVRARVVAPWQIRTRTRLVAGGVLLVLLLILIPLAVLTADSWRDLFLNLIAEVGGAALIFFVIDRLLKAEAKQRLRDQRREAIEDLRFVLIELRTWLARIFFESTAGLSYWAGTDPNRIPVETFIESLPDYFGKVDFAAPGPYKRDRFFIEWARRTFSQTVAELRRWELNFAGAAGIFEDDFREGAEKLHTFIRAMSSFLEGMELYVRRETPKRPVHAYEDVTELSDENVERLVASLRDFLVFYRDQCKTYGAEIPNLDLFLR